MTAQLPAAGQGVPGNSQVLLYYGEEPGNEEISVPDFVGMTRQQASDEAGKRGLYILITGNADTSPNVKVTSQAIPKDTLVKRGTTIQLEFADTKAAD